MLSECEHSSVTPSTNTSDSYHESDIEFINDEPQVQGSPPLPDLIYSEPPGLQGPPVLQSTHLGEIPPHNIGLSPIQPTLTKKLQGLPTWTGENAQYRDQQHAFQEEGLTRSKP